MGQRSNLKSALGFLANVSKGKATVSVKGTPLVQLDAETRTIDVDVDGLRAAGVRIWDLVGQDEGMFGGLKGPVRIASEMSELGWSLAVYAGKEKVLTVGSGLSRLTGRIGLNPLKTRKLLKALR